MAPAVTLYPVYAAYCENARKLFQNYMNSPTNVSKELKNLPEVMEQDKTVTHHNGVEVRLTLFRPSGTQNQSLPVVLFFHGGGWIFGSKHTHVKPVRNVSCFHVCLLKRQSIILY